MIKKISLAVITTLSLTTAQAASAPTPNMAEAKALLDSMLKQNQAYISNQGKDFFKNKAKGQTPTATIVGCSDSRVHTSLLADAPEGQLFTINNIGNQINTALGSVKYGVNHLNTPLLLILGHSQCGAVSAALAGDYSKLEPSIASELEHFQLPKGISNIEGVKLNVHHQVDAAMARFKQKIDNNELLVVGAVYDFSNDMQKGAGKLNVINVQGKHLD